MDKYKVLYVDDEQVNLILFEINLKRKYNVLTANSGSKGIQLFKENNDIKVIISDMKMPEMNGIEFIRKIKEINQNIACFILTGYGLIPEIEEVMEEGLILDCLSKPFEMEKIDKKIQSAINE